MTDASINTNLQIWTSVEATDPKYTKQFNRGGGFRGTATNATYLAKKATQQFGPIGIGWGYNVIDEKYQPGQDKDVIHVVRIKFWYVWNDQRGEIEHFGQTTFVGKNKNGYYTDEEAPKKSLTDAVSKCLSLLGFASDIHLGLYDDNRYVNDLKRDFRDGDEFDDRQTNRPSNDNARDGEQGEKQATQITQDMLDDIDKCKDIKDLTDLMNSKGMKADMQSVSKDEEKQVRDHATKKLKALGWTKPEKAEAANG